MLSLDATQLAIVAEPNKDEISWLFQIDRTGNDVINDYWSTKAKTWDGHDYIFKIADFDGIEMNRSQSEEGIQAPSSFDFVISNPNNYLTPADFSGGNVTLLLVISAGGNEAEIRRWNFDIKWVTPGYQTLSFHCVDWVQKYLKGNYPMTLLINYIFPGTNQDENACVPLIFGKPCIPVMPLIETIITNGYMEEDGYWIDWGDTVPYIHEQSDEHVYEGDYSRKFQVHGASGRSGIRSAGFTTENGKTYVIDFWWYPINCCLPYVAVRSGDDSTWILYDEFITDGDCSKYNDRWNHSSLTFTEGETTGGSLAHIVFYYWAEPDTYRTLYVDQVFVGQSFYLLGEKITDPEDYDVDEVQTPSKWNGDKQIWSKNDYTFDYEHKTGQDGNDYTMGRFIVKDENGDDTPDSNITFKQGSSYLPVGAWYTRSDTIDKTSPADILDYILQEWGIPSSRIDATTLAAVKATYSGWGLTWNMGLWTLTDRKELLARLLCMCHTELIVRDKIYFKVHTKTSQKTLTKAEITKAGDKGKGSFTYDYIETDDVYDAGYVSYQEKKGNLDSLLKTLVTVKGATDTIADETVPADYIQDTQDAQRVGTLALQRKYLPNAEIGFDAKGTCLALECDDVITINHADYGGTYDVLINGMKITKGGALEISALHFSDSLDDWTDLSPSIIYTMQSANLNSFQTLVTGSTAAPGSMSPSILQQLANIADATISQDQWAWLGAMDILPTSATLDGATDDQAALQADYDSLPAGGRTLYFPDGDCKLDSNVTYDTTKPLKVMAGPDLHFIGTGIPPTYVSNTGHVVAGNYDRVVALSGEAIHRVTYGAEIIANSGFTNYAVAAYFGARCQSGSSADIWGINPLVQLIAGSTGNAIGNEVDVDNYANNSYGVGELITGIGDHTCLYGIHIRRANYTSDWAVGLQINNSSIGLLVDGSNVVSPGIGFRIYNWPYDHIKMQPSDDDNPTYDLISGTNAANSQYQFHITKAGKGYFRELQSIGAISNTEVVDGATDKISVNTQIELQVDSTGNATGIQTALNNYANNGYGVGQIITGIGDHTCNYGLHIKRENYTSDWAVGLVIKNSSVGAVVDGSNVVSPGIGFRIYNWPYDHIKMQPSDDDNPTYNLISGVNAADSQYQFHITKAGKGYFRGGLAYGDAPVTLSVTATQLNYLDSITGIGIADDNVVQMDDADAEDNDYAKFTANGLEGRSYTETLSDLSGQAGADFSMNTHKITGVVDPGANQDAATKKYVDDQVAAMNQLSELTDVTITGPADLDLLQFDNGSSKWVDRSLTEAGVQAALTFGIADTNALLVDDADAAANDFAKFTASGLAGRSYAEVLSDLSAQAGAAFDFNAQNITNIGIVYADQLAHYGDTNTYIDFDTDIIDMQAGGTRAVYIDADGDVGIRTIPLANFACHIMGIGTGNTTYGLVVKDINNNNNNFWIRDDGAGYLRAASWTHGSDRRLKENIRYFKEGLDAILRLMPVEFDYIDGLRNQRGFVAQDVQAVIPDAVEKDMSGMLGLRSNFILPYLVNAIKELQAKITTLQEELL